MKQFFKFVLATIVGVLFLNNPLYFFYSQA
jgi:hypothetical protein